MAFHIRSTEVTMCKYHSQKIRRVDVLDVICALKAAFTDYSSLLTPAVTIRDKSSDVVRIQSSLQQESPFWPLSVLPS